MNNSDYNDFNGWQNDDENEMNNPNNWIPKNGFFFYNSNNPMFKKMWEQINNEQNFMDQFKNYMNMDDIMNHLKPADISKQPNKKASKQQKPKPSVFSQDDYLKLIEIRGYLAITEQFAHVKALDKLLSQIVIIPKDQR